MWTKLYDLDGRCVDTFTDINALKDRVADQVNCESDAVHVDDRYNDDGDCIEVITVDGIGDVGTLDRKAPEWFKPKEAAQ